MEGLRMPSMKTMNLGHYILGDMGWDKSSTGGYTINVYQPFTAKEFAIISSQLADIKFYESGISLCKLTHACFMDLVKSIESAGHKYLSPKYSYSQLTSDIHEDFFKNLMNALSMFKSLREHAEVSLLKRFGKGSPQHKSWLSCQSSIYDRSFAYRLFHNLRNYCQHVGLPSLLIDLEGVPRVAPGYDTVKVNLMLDPEQLLSSYKNWGAQAKKDLEHSVGNIKLTKYVNEWGHDICDLVNLYVEMLREEVYDSAVSILSMRAIYGVGPQGRLGLFELEGGVLKHGQHATQALPEEICRLIYTGHDVYVGDSVFAGELSTDGVLLIRRDG